jgi:hypothetical protein
MCSQSGFELVLPPVARSQQLLTPSQSIANHEQARVVLDGVSGCKSGAGVYSSTYAPQGEVVRSLSQSVFLAHLEVDLLGRSCRQRP